MFGWDLVEEKVVATNEGTDTYDKLLIHFDGADAATTDYTAETGQTVSLEGTAQLDTAQKVFGSASLLLDGDSDYVTIPDNANWAFGTGDFTIEFWFKRNDSNRQQMIYGQCDSGGADASFSFLGYFLADNTLVSWIYSETEHVRHTISSTGTIIDTDWHHYALVRNGTTVYQYIDGTQDGSVAFDHTANDSAELVTFGRFGSVASGYFNGWLDEIRICKGIARWTSDFSASLPTAAYGVTSYTFSDLDGDTDEEYRLICRQVGGVAGSWNKLIFNADAGTNYGYQYLGGASTTVTASRNSYTSIIGSRNTFASGEVGMFDYLLYVKSGYIRTGLVKSTIGIATTTVTEISTIGVSWNNTADNLTSIQVHGDATAGLGTGTHLFLFKKRTTAGGCWVQEYAHTVVTNEGLDTYDKLLVHFDGADAATADYTAETGQTVSLEGTAQLDTAQKVFGTASLLLDGDSDYATVPHSADWDFGSGDFTVECRVRFSSVAAGPYAMVGQYALNDRAWIFAYSNVSSQITFGWSTNGTTSSWADRTWSPEADTWYHVAVVRNGNAGYIFINGVQTGADIDFTGVTIYNSGNGLAIGRSDYATWYFPGWIEEVRVCKGIARWTDDFTPPTTEYGLTSLTISSLNGEADKLYELRVRTINTKADGDTYLRINNDTGTNYGYQRVSGADTTADATRDTSETYDTLNVCGTSGNIGYTQAIIYAKSGYIRTILQQQSGYIATTTISSIRLYGYSWNNTADNITSLVVGQTTTAGLGVGTVIELWKFSPSVAYTQACSETATISEILYKSVGRALTESATITALINNGVERYLYDTSTISDALSKDSIITRLDGITISEIRNFASTREILETTTLTDDYGRVWDIIHILSDSITITDVSLKSPNRVLVDEIITINDRLQEWMDKNPKPTVWSVVTGTSGIWTIVGPASDTWTHVGT